LQSNVEGSSFRYRVAIFDNEQFSDKTDEETDESFYSNSGELIYSIEAPPYSSIAMEDAGSGDEDLGIDFILPMTNETCKTCIIYDIHVYIAIPYVFNQHHSPSSAVEITNESVSSPAILPTVDLEEANMLSATDELCNIKCDG